MSDGLMGALDTEAAAEFLNVTVGTLWTYRHRQTGPASFRVGRSVFYRISDLEEWINRPRVAGRPLKATVRLSE